MVGPSKFVYLRLGPAAITFNLNGSAGYVITSGNGFTPNGYIVVSVASKILNSKGISQTSFFSVIACNLNEPNPVDVLEWAVRYPWLIRYL